MTADTDALLRQAMEALMRWEVYGCPDCGGDCGSANPPVSFCIMAETRETIAALAAASSQRQEGE